MKVKELVDIISGAENLDYLDNLKIQRDAYKKFYNCKHGYSSQNTALTIYIYLDSIWKFDLPPVACNKCKNKGDNKLYKYWHTPDLEDIYMSKNYGMD